MAATASLPSPPLRSAGLPSLLEVEYSERVWPFLRSRLLTLLHPPSPSHPPLSMETLARAVYNACCCGFAERLHGDLLGLVESDASERAALLPLDHPSIAAAHMEAMHSLLPIVRSVFAYLDREYASGELLERLVQRMESGFASHRGAGHTRYASLKRCNSAPTGPLVSNRGEVEDASKRFRSDSTVGGHDA